VNGTSTAATTTTTTTTKKDVEADKAEKGGEPLRDASDDDGFDDGEGSGEDGDRSVEDDGTPMSMTENDTKATGPSTSGGEEGEEEEEEEGDAAAADGETPQTKYKPPNQSRENRRVRMFRSASEITQEELASCFHLPSEAACRKLGVGLTVLKRQCRKYGIKRWPFRKMKSLDRLITNVQAGISPGDQNKLLVKSVEELEDQKRRMEECAMLDLDDTTKRLQQAYSKANHKARRNRSEAARIRAQAAANAVRELEAKQKGVPSDVGRRKTVSEEQALLTLAHQLVAKDGKPVEESHAAAAAAMAAHATNKEGLENADDDKMNKPLISLLSNTPTKKAVQSPAATAAPAPASVEVKREEGAAATKTGAPTSNPMPKKGGAAFTDTQVAAEKVLTAVKGAWSPARPARKQDGVDNAEAFLSPMLKRRPAGGENGGEEAETKQRAPKRAATPAKQPVKQPAKRGRKRKEPSVDDDPLASLAAAALDSMGGGGRSSGGGGSSRGRKASGSPTKTSTATTTTTTTTAMNDATAAANDATAAANADASNKSNAAGARLSAPAVTEDHPAFALPAVKGARSGSSSTRLHHLDLVEVTKLIAEQLQTARGEIFKHFPNLPERELDRAFNVARVSRAVSSGIEALAKRGAAASKKK
jgi:hypothetical protein